MILLHDWSGKTANDVFEEFDGTRWGAYKEEDSPPAIERTEFAGFEILLGSYTYECYSGEAFVLAIKDGRLYEVNGSHCSCYGLEGMWNPEETSIEALRHRMKNGRLGYGLGGFAAELEAVLSALEATK